MINVFIFLPHVSHFQTPRVRSMSDDLSPTGVPGVATQRTAGKERMQLCTAHQLSRNTCFQSFQNQAMKLWTLQAFPIKTTLKYTHFANRHKIPWPYALSCKGREKSVVPTGKQSRHPKETVRRMCPLKSDSHMLTPRLPCTHYTTFRKAI